MHTGMEFVNVGTDALVAGPLDPRLHLAKRFASHSGDAHPDGKRPSTGMESPASRFTDARAFALAVDAGKVKVALRF